MVQAILKERLPGLVPRALSRVWPLFARERLAWLVRWVSLVMRLLRCRLVHHSRPFLLLHCRPLYSDRWERRLSTLIPRRSQHRQPY